MAYNWAQLAFVEKWRLQSVRGQIVGMHRPFDRTLFELRLRPGEGNVGPIPSPLDVHLLDAGDIIREKRIGFLNASLVVIFVVGRLAASEAQAGTPHPKRLLDAGSIFAGTL